MSGIRIGKPGKNGPSPVGVSITRKINRSLSSGQPCTYLVTLDKKGLPYNHASSQNICRGQTTKEKQGLRIRTLGYAKIPHKIQNTVCLANYHECEHFMRKQKEALNEPLPTEIHARQLESKAQAPPKPPKKSNRKRSARMSPIKSEKLRTIKQLGAISSATIALAFIVSFFVAGGPGRIIENITFMFIQSQAQDLGLNKDDLEKVKASGILQGGSMAGLKKLSRSQKRKLRGSALFKGMSSEKKAELKKKFGKR